MERCCANCEYHISPELEDAILEEQSCYTEDCFDRPMAGDCVLGQVHDENFCCSQHLYCDGTERTYALYDDKYAGTGFLIIHTVDDEIDKFFKISSCVQSSLPHFLICGCEKGSKSSLNQRFRTISFTIDKDNELFLTFDRLAQNFGKQKLYSFDGLLSKKDNIQFVRDGDNVIINLNKDILGVKNSIDFTNINLVYNYNCQCYNLLSEFYNDLSKLSINTSADKDIEELKFMQKRYYKNF